MITRISKIARLPINIREQLNRRLNNGQTGGTLLKWVNQLPKTKKVLAELFAGNAITHQNLSEWRRAGYQDWLQQQQRIDWFDHFCENETELAKHENCGDTFEAMSRIFIAEIGQSIAALRNIKNPRERSDCLQNLAREFSRLQNAFNFSRKTQLAFDKHNGPPAAEPEPSEDEDNTEEPEAHDLAPLGAPASRRHDATNPPEPHMEPEATSPSPPRSGGEEALRAQGDHQDLANEHEPALAAVCPPTEDRGLKTADLNQTCQAIPPYSPTPPSQSRPTPVHQHIVHSIPFRGRRFRCIEG